MKLKLHQRRSRLLNRKAKRAADKLWTRAVGIHDVSPRRTYEMRTYRVSGGPWREAKVDIGFKGDELDGVQFFADGRRSFLLLGTPEAPRRCSIRFMRLEHEPAPWSDTMPPCAFVREGDAFVYVGKEFPSAAGDHHA